MKIHVKESKDLILPVAATSHSSGYDVVAIEDPKIVGVKDEDSWKSIDYIEYKTGLFIAPQTDPYNHNYHTLIFPRSSVRKYSLILANSIGLIDNDYRGEIILCFKYIWNPEDLWWTMDWIDEKMMRKTLRGNVNVDKIYKKGDKIGQLVSEVSNPTEWIVVSDLSNTVRGSGGFGHSDKKLIEHPKESVNLINKWKELGDMPIPQKYESVVKEREKLIS